MGTTTIRIDTQTYARLVELGDAADSTIIDTVRDAVEALRRQRFGQQVAQELADLRSDPEAWASYLAEADDIPESDGLR